MRRNDEVKSSATPARQLRKLDIQNRHIHLIEIKCCEDTRRCPARSLTATTQRAVQTTSKCRDHSPHNLPGCRWDYLYCPHPGSIKKLGIDLQRSTKLAPKLHAHSVQNAHKLTLTRRAIEIKNTSHNPGALGPHASRDPPGPH
eukprot:1160226-Pelagomonas_calceolata.AAC.6